MSAGPPAPRLRAIAGLAGQLLQRAGATHLVDAHLVDVHLEARSGR